MSDIALYLDQDNELRFNVAIEGSKPGTAKYRLVFEGRNFNYTFNGKQAAPGEVSFVIPTMKNLMKEGSYHAALEVMIDDRYFTPLTFDASFEESVKVTAEAVSRPTVKKTAVSASMVTARPTFSKPVLENAAPTRPAQAAHRKLESDVNFIGEVDGKRVSVDDLRELIRSRR